MLDYDRVGYAARSFYDRLGRKVAQVDREDILTVWTLDANGNAETETRYASRVTARPRPAASVATLSGWSAAAMPSVDRTTNFAYDRNGRRLTEKRTNVVAWTASGLALSAADPPTRPINYDYNELGLVDQQDRGERRRHLLRL